LLASLERRSDLAAGAIQFIKEWNGQQEGALQAALGLGAAERQSKGS